MLATKCDNRHITLYTNPLTTLLMIVFFFVSGLAGQANPGQTSSGDVPRPPVQTSPPQTAQKVLQGKTVIVDPGHGGGDSGTVGVGKTTEAQNVLAIGREVKEMLENSGARVVMTRSTDINPANGTSFQNNINGQLAARTAIANRSGGDIYVSIHNDWNDNRALAGTTTYYYHSHDWLLADSLQKALVNQLGTRDVGARRGNFYVLRNTSMPSALVEVGFLSNSREADLLSKSWYRTEAARGIYQGILDYFQRAGS